ncbi:MAG: hypothetical protein AAGA48_00230 [Myxococcota bacterium]
MRSWCWGWLFTVGACSEGAMDPDASTGACGVETTETAEFDFAGSRFSLPIQDAVVENEFGNVGGSVEEWFWRVAVTAVESDGTFLQIQVTDSGVQPLSPSYVIDGTDLLNSIVHTVDAGNCSPDFGRKPTFTTNLGGQGTVTVEEVSRNCVALSFDAMLLDGNFGNPACDGPELWPISGRVSSRNVVVN